MKKLILTSATILFVGLAAFAGDNNKEKKENKKCEKKCQTATCTNDESCSKKCCPYQCCPSQKQEKAAKMDKTVKESSDKK